MAVDPDRSIEIGSKTMRPSYRTWIGSLLVVLVTLVACTNSSLDPTSATTLAPTATPLAAPTQVPTIAVTPTQATIWPTEDWQYSTPEDQGLDSLILEQMSQDIRANVPAARSILVVRNGYVVYEDYFMGDESYAGPIWSVTKSIISALIGIALEEGDIGGIEDKLFEYLGEYDTEDINPYFDEITIEHLLTMTAGFGYIQGGASSVPAAFREELVSRPGEEASYSSTGLTPKIWTDS